MKRSVLALGLAVLAGHAAAETPEIGLPRLLAVTLPAGSTTLSADDAPLRILLAGARSPGHTVTARLPADRIGVGAWTVVWSAWRDASATGRPLAQHSATVTVLPTGTIPVGLSADENATAGNNAAHIVRDDAGYVHMLWVDSGRADGLVGAIYRRGDPAPDGSVTLDPATVELAGPGQGEWNAYPGLAAVGQAVDFVWQGGGTAHYRQLTHGAEGWHWSDPVDIGAKSTGRDVGPAIAADAASVDIVTPDGVFAWSADAGRHWASEALPIPDKDRVKSASIALDPQGRPVVAATVVVAIPGPLSEDHGSGGYWTLMLWRRNVDGRWERLTSPLAGRPEWAAPGDLKQDVLADWTRIAIDPTGGMHVTWHGTAVSRIYGNDRAYYAWHGPGTGAGDGWHGPVPLRDPDAARGFGFSYAPSVTLAGDVALPLVFYIRGSGVGDVYDADLLGFRDGVPVMPRRPVTRYMQDSIAAGEPGWGLGARFPAAAPAVYRTGDGRVWLDILETLVPTSDPDAAKLIVYQRIDLTDSLGGLAVGTR